MENDISRRALLAGACSIVALGATAIPAAAESTVTTLPDGRLSVRVRGIAALSKTGGAVKIGNLRGVPVALARTGASTYVAFTLVCPHFGAWVQRTRRGWTCPAHNSTFTANGTFVSGPANASLPRIPVTMSRGRAIVG